MTVTTIPEAPRLWFWLRLAVTLGVLALLWQALDGPVIAQTLTQASPFWLTAAIVALILQTALSAQRWRVTAAQLGQRLSARFALREYFLSQAFNQALPGAVMGDAARSVRARSQGGLVVATQAVFFERLAGQIAMVLTLVIAFLCTHLVTGGLDWPSGWSAMLFLVCAVTGLGISLALVGTLMGGRSSSVSRWLRPLHAALFSRRVLPAQILLGAAITACNLAAFAFAARAVGVELSVIEVAALVPLILFAMLVPFTISGWGVREGAAALVLPIAGVSATSSVAASILFGLALLVAVSPGALMVMAR